MLRTEYRYLFTHLGLVSGSQKPPGKWKFISVWEDDKINDPTLLDWDPALVSALRGMSSITVATSLAMNCGMTRENSSWIWLIPLIHLQKYWRYFINDTCLFERKTFWKVNNIASLFLLVKEIRKFAFFQCPKYLLYYVWSSLSLSVLTSLPFHFSYYYLNFPSLNFVSLLNPSSSFPNSFSLN